MRPLLFQILSMPVHAYTAAVFVGALLFIALVECEVRRLRLDPARLHPLMLLLFVSAVAGARLLNGILHWEVYADHPLRLLIFWRGGMASYGLVLVSAPLFLWYVRRHRLNGWQVADALAPGFALFIAVMRVGCFLSGCCYGKACSPDFPLGVTFPMPLEGLPRGGPVHPYQLYASAAALTLFLVLWVWRKRKRFEGQLALFFMIWYPLTRLVLECFRGDPRTFANLAGRPVSLLQIIGVPILVFALWAYARKSRAAQRPADDSPT